MAETLAERRPRVRAAPSAWRRACALWVAALAGPGLARLAGWCALDPSDEFGVARRLRPCGGPCGSSSGLGPGAAWARPTSRATRARAIELPLPRGRGRCGSRRRDGSRFGFRRMGHPARASERPGARSHRAARRERDRAACCSRRCEPRPRGSRPGSERRAEPATLARDLERALRSALCRAGTRPATARRSTRSTSSPSRPGAAAGRRRRACWSSGSTAPTGRSSTPCSRRGACRTWRALLDQGARAQAAVDQPDALAGRLDHDRDGRRADAVTASSTSSSRARRAGARQPVTSVQRRVPTVWEMLSRAGVDVGVIGWWATWPADAGPRLRSSPTVWPISCSASAPTRTTRAARPGRPTCTTQIRR